jgi:hypothetical protein
MYILAFRNDEVWIFGLGKVKNPHPKMTIETVYFVIPGAEHNEATRNPN